MVKIQINGTKLQTLNLPDANIKLARVIIPLCTDTFNTPDFHFDLVHIDLVGPLPTSQGCTYLLTCVDCFTRLPEATVSTI